MLTKELPVPAPNPDWVPRALAIAEVASVSLLSCVLWQGFKRLTAAGQMEVSSGFNFSPGIVMLVVTICLFIAHRKIPADFGVSLKNWPDLLNAGVALTLIVMLTGLLSRFLFVKFHGNFHAAYGSSRSPYLIDATVAVLFVAFLPWILRFSQSLSSGVPTTAALAILIGLWIAPLAIASALHHDLGHASLVVLGLVVTTGCAEELFYWGYILPRLNQVWDRAYKFGGIRFGLGLLITALLFGLIHCLNGVDLLHGCLNLNWGWGLAALCAGLAHGLLREATDSIVPGAILHGLNDIWLLMILPVILG